MLKKLSHYNFITILKTSAICTLLLAFFLFFQNCTCQEDYFDETGNDNLTDIDDPPVTEPPVTEPPVTEPPVTEPPKIDPPEITFSAPTDTPIYVNVGDGFIPFLPSVTMSISNADFESTKIDDTAKPCDNAFTISIKDDTDADVPLSTQAAVSCAFVDKDAVTLTITPPVIDTNAYSISNNQAVKVLLEATVDSSFTTASTNVTTSTDLDASVLAIGYWAADMSPIAVADQGHAHFFGNTVITIDPTKPNSIKDKAASYGAGYLSALAVGLQKYDNKSTYYLFEPSSSSSTTSGFFTLQIIDLSDPDALQWTSYSLGGPIGYNNSGAYINHNAPFIAENSYFTLVALHGGYNHRFSTSASYSPYAPLVRTTPIMNTYNLLADNSNNLDAGHVILQVDLETMLKVGRYQTPYFQQLKQAAYTDTITFNDLSGVVTGSYTPTADNFAKGNKALRSVNGKHYVYVLGDTTPFVAEMTISGNDITGLSLTEIDNPVDSSFSLNSPRVVYDETNDVLVLIVEIRYNLNEIFIGKFDDGDDATPTWTRYF